MKKGTIILLMTILFPLLCSAVQQRIAGSATVPMEDILQPKECNRQQLPFENDREYADFDMWCLLQALSATNHSAKWQGGASGKAVIHILHTPLLAVLANTSPHILSQTDDCSVFIRLHHLII